MPIIDVAAPDIGAPLAAPAPGRFLTPGAEDVDHGSDAPTERPAWTPTFRLTESAIAATNPLFAGIKAVADIARTPAGAAAFRQDNTVGALLAAEDRDVPLNREPGFNPWDAIKGTEYEGHWQSFVNVHNPVHAEAVKRKIDREKADRKLLDSLPWYQSLPAQMAAGAIDLPSLLPGGAFVRGTQGGIAIGRSALNVALASGVSSTAQELALHGITETRTIGESALNIGASVFLGGLLGAGGAKVMSRGEWARATRDMERELYLGTHVPGTAIEGRLLNEAGVTGDELASHLAWFEAYHASPHDFERFDLSRVGTGEGLQAYGHGLYFSESEAVHREYLKNFSGTIIGGKPFDPQLPEHWAAGAVAREGDRAKAAEYLVQRRIDLSEEAQPRVDRAIELLRSDAPLPTAESARSYRVRVNADQTHLLDWDMPFSHQDAAVKAALEKLGLVDGQRYGENVPVPDLLGDEIYRQLVAKHGNPVAASRALQDAGVLGIKYLDDGSRHRPLTFHGLTDQENALIANFSGRRGRAPDVTFLDEIREPTKAFAGNLRYLRDYYSKSPFEEDRAVVPIVDKVLASGNTAPLRGNETRNFVVFDDALVEIVGKDGIPIARPSMADGGAPTSAGAAANLPSDITGNAIAGRAAGAVAASTQRLNPLLRALHSPSAAWREVSTQMFENPLYLKKNFEGVASQPAVETLMKEWNAGLAKAVTATQEAFSEYRKAGGPLGRDEFRQAVGRAMRRGDADPDPHVTRVAQAWRKDVFDPLKEAAIKAGLLPADVSVETAASYFSRMWNRNRLIAREGEFKGIVTPYYAEKIGQAYEADVAAFNYKIAKLNQEIADLNLAPDARLKTLKDVEDELKALDGKSGDMPEQADRLSEINAEIRNARQAMREDGIDAAQAASIKASIEALQAEAAELKKTGGTALAGFLNARADLRARHRNIDLGAAGLQERSEKLLGSLADLEETNHRAMERLVKKGQKLERDLDRLDADALEERVTQLADQYGTMARRARAAAERATKAIESIRAAGEQGAERNATVAARATVEAATGPAEEAAAKRAVAAEAANRQRERRAAADAKAQERLELEATRQQARAEAMAKVAQRLEVAKNLDHDAIMAEVKGAIDKAIRETSASSMARGERAARIGERIASLDPERVAERVKVIQSMKADAERAFFDRWEVRNLGDGVDPASAARPDFTEAARAIADQAHATLSGRAGQGVRPEFLTITTRGPMKERTFNIPDALIEDFLEHDVDLVGRRYARVMGADVEIANKFGSVDMKDQVQAIRDDYTRMRQGLTDEARLTELGKAEKNDIKDLEQTRDLLRGSSIFMHPIEENYGKLARSFAHFNYLRSMGEVALASLSETIRPAMVHGLMPYLGFMGNLATNLKGVKLSLQEARLAGNVSERVLGHRLATISEIIDPYASRGPVEAFLENMTNVASKWNGIRLLTDMQKSVASVMTQDRILSGATGFAGLTGRRGGRERGYLNYLGIDESMAGRIAKQFTDHGETVDGVRVANTEAWTDDVARRTYRAAINKDVDSIITTKGVADVPLFANTPTGKVLLQFKSFFLASHQRVLLRGLQEDQARFVGGLVAMAGVGMLVTYMKALSGNREEKLADFAANPGWWIAEGIDKSGIFSVPMELSNMFEKAAGLNPIKSPIKAFDQGSRMSQRTQNRSEIGTWLGPTVGTGQDIITALGSPKTKLQQGEVTKGQMNAGERLIPFNSYFGMRQMLRYLVNPQ